MGLDMYLTEKIYVKNWDHTPEEHRVAITATRGGKPFVKVEKIEYLETEAAYWRKANAIHLWFVKNVQDGADDCGQHYVSEEKLKELVDTCQQVLDNRELAHELLPTTSGFFFGSTEYDEWYFKDLEYTVKTLTELLDEPEGSFYYQSSW